jgi:uncharacterized protein (DUF58 family)
MKVLSRHAVVFLISDFLAPGFDRPLRIAARKYDLVAIRIEDPREESLPSVGLVEMEDAESGERRVIDTADPRLREELSKAVSDARARLARELKKAGADLIRLSTDKPYDVPLVRYFEERAKAAR